MLLSVVIAFIDKDKQLLHNCIATLEKSAKAAGVRLNFILVANGTSVPVNLLRNNFSAVKISQNVGFAKAVNRGLAKVKTEWGIIACPDTRCEKGTIKALLPYIKRGPLASLQGDPLFKKIAIVGPKILEPDGNIQETIVPIPTLKSIFIEQTYLYRLFPAVFSSPLTDRKGYNRAHRTDAIAAIWWLVNRDAIMRVGCFDERYFLYFEDVDLCKRLAEAGFRVFYQPRARIKHFLHQSTGGGASGRLYRESMGKFLKKHYGVFVYILGNLLLTAGSLARLIFWGRKNTLSARREARFYRDILRVWR